MNMRVARKRLCHPNYLHYFASASDGSHEGVAFPNVSDALLGPGQSAEADCPYQQNDPPPTWAPPPNVIMYRRRSTSPAQSTDEIEALLDAGHVPVLGIATTNAFYAPAPPWVIPSTGPVRGLHAVAAVGVGTTHTTRCFLIRNSWGAAWADAGHAWLDDAFIVQHLRDVLVLTDEVA